MAVTEEKSKIRLFDENGNEYILYPETKIACVEGLTEALAGKAPVGYGLGGTATWIPEADALKGYNANGWYYWSASNTDPDKPFGAGSMVSIRRSLSYWTQLAFEDGSYTGGIRVRKIIEGNAQPWEWVNPPMVVGVEYRTIERWQGKAVYVKTINAGSLMADGTVDIPISGTNNPYILRHTAQLNRNALPMNNYDIWTDLQFASATSFLLRMHCGTASLVGGTLYVTMWYTKD